MVIWKYIFQRFHYLIVIFHFTRETKCMQKHQEKESETIKSTCDSNFFCTQREVRAYYLAFCRKERRFNKVNNTSIAKIPKKNS